MTRHVRMTALGIAAVTALSLQPLTAQSNRGDKNDAARSEIRRELLQLPYYGVFDFLAFKYDRGTAELMGYAYTPTLKQDAERAVRRAGGVDEVRNRIEQLPPSQQDDDLRWRIYYSIYTDPFLSRYAPGSAQLWGHRHGFGGFAGLMDGMEPAGNYPIHIIVRNGRVELMGVVDNDGDRTIAEMKARQVPGSFEVKNDLVVERSGRKRT